MSGAAHYLRPDFCLHKTTVAERDTMKFFGKKAMIKTVKGVAASQATKMVMMISVLDQPGSRKSIDSD